MYNRYETINSDYQLEATNFKFIQYVLDLVLLQMIINLVYKKQNKKDVFNIIFKLITNNIDNCMHVHGRVRL